MVLTYPDSQASLRLGMRLGYIVMIAELTIDSLLSDLVVLFQENVLLKRQIDASLTEQGAQAEAEGMMS